MPDWWEQRPWRMIQTNLREIDMLDIDAGRYVADLQAFRANMAMINAAGIIASYPTDLPFHFQSPYLQGDSLEEIITACHAADIRVIARTDFSKVRRPIYEMHPDWAYRTAEGNIVDYNGDVHVCINGDYQQHYALEILGELLSRYAFDGIFFNMGGYQTRDYSGNEYGLCHCQSCQRRFAQLYGKALPERRDLSDPVYRQYLLFQEQTMAEHSSRVSQFIYELRPDICVDKDFQLERGFIRQEANTAMDRPLPRWQYSASANTKWAVASYPDMLSSSTTVDFIDFPYRHVAVSPHQQALRLAQNLANGRALDYYLIGRLDDHEDRSGFKPIANLFRFHAQHEDIYQNLISCADIALLRSGRATANRQAFRGWFRFLAENHYLFDTPRVEAYQNIAWPRYKTIIVPDIQAIGDELASRLNSFVANGGTLIATGRAGFRDDAYEPRDQPALSMLGIEEIERVRHDMRSSYLKRDQATDWPKELDTDLFYLDGPYVYARYSKEAEEHLKLVPPHNYGPPERCYYETVVDRPGYTERRLTDLGGRAIYVPWLPGELFYRQGHTNTIDFAAGLLQRVAGAHAIVGNLSPMVEITLRRSADGERRVAHLVNASGHFGNSFYAPVEMSDLDIVLPCQQEPATVAALVSQETLRYNWDSGRLTIKLSRLGLFEALEMRFVPGMSYT